MSIIKYSKLLIKISANSKSPFSNHMILKTRQNKSAIRVQFAANPSGSNIYLNHPDIQREISAVVKLKITSSAPILS